MRFERLSSGSGRRSRYAEPLELAEEIVEGLLAHPQSRRQLRGPRALWPGVLEDRQIRRVEIVEAARVQAVEHVLLDGLPRQAEQGADEGRSDRSFLHSRGSKTT